MQTSPNCRLQGVPKFPRQHLHPSVWQDHAAKSSKGSLSTHLVPSSASRFCPLPAPGPSLWLFAHSPTKHHRTTTPKCQIHLLMVSQVQSAQQKAGYLEPDEGEAPQLHQPGGSSKLCTCSWVTPVVHRTGPSPAQGPRAMGYSPHPLQERSDCIQTAQHCLGCSWVPSEKLPDCTGHSCAGDMLRNNIHKCRTSSEANICFSNIS